MFEYGLTVGRSGSGAGLLTSVPDLFVWAILGAGMVLLVSSLIRRGQCSNGGAVMGIVLAIAGIVLGRITGLLCW